MHCCNTAHEQLPPSFCTFTGLLDSMGGFWSTVAGYFKEDDNILGYELINEPWAGDVYADPGLILPTIADMKNLQPAYDHLNKAIRAKDDQHR